MTRELYDVFYDKFLELDSILTLPRDENFPSTYFRELITLQ